MFVVEARNDFSSCDNVGKGGNIMLKKVLIIVSVVTLYMAFGLDHSWAACSQKDLTGTWYAYFNGIKPGAPSWGRGTINVNSVGNIQSGAKIYMFDVVTKKTSIFIVKNGKFTVNSACIVTGYVNLEMSGFPFYVKVVNSAMDRGKTVVHGVWQGKDKADTGMMTIIKK